MTETSQAQSWPGAVTRPNDWAVIRQLVAEGVPQRQVARDLGIDRKTVGRALASDRPPSYGRRQGPTSFDEYESRVRGLLERFPSMPASVIAERVGWAGSPSWFRQNVAVLRPLYVPVDPADRLDWAPGDVVQCDLWFPPFNIPLEDGTAMLLPVLVMVAAFSRTVMGLMIPSRSSEDLLMGMWVLLQQLGKVPHRLIWDNEKGIGRGKKLAQQTAMFAGALGCEIYLLKARDPESKGSVERRNGWFETSFMPGRDFVSPADFNLQFTGWLELANNRLVRTTGARPVDRLPADLAAMRPLPPAVFGLGWHNQVRMGRDYYVSIAGNDYSVDPHAIGRIVDVTATLDRVRVKCEGRLVADHERVWLRGQTVTDPAHVATAKQLRIAFQQPRPVDIDDGLARDLGDYDLAFGLNGWAA